jgi:hypothetical protein
MSVFGGMSIADGADLRSRRLPSRRSRFGEAGVSEGWRRGRDSNPWYPSGYSGFQDHRHRPLGHPSESKAEVRMLKAEGRSGCFNLTTGVLNCEVWSPRPQVAQASPPRTVCADRSGRLGWARRPLGLHFRRGASDAVNRDCAPLEHDLRELAGGVGFSGRCSAASTTSIDQWRPPDRSRGSTRRASGGRVSRERQNHRQAIPVGESSPSGVVVAVARKSSTARSSKG